MNLDSEGAISKVILKCQSCELAWAQQRSPKVRQVQSNLDTEGAISCAIPKCQSCELARAQQRSPKVKQVQSNLDSEGAISCNHNEESMRNCEVATKDMVPTPATQGGHVSDIPLLDGALISNDYDSLSPIQNQREVLVVPTLMIMVPRVLFQMRELKDLTLPLMVKVGVGPHKNMTLLRG